MLWKKKVYLFQTLFFFKQQTTQTPKEKNNPNHKYQNAIATLLLLSQQKKLVPKHGLTFLLQFLSMIGFICKVNSYSCLLISVRNMDGKGS